MLTNEVASGVVIKFLYLSLCSIYEFLTFKTRIDFF